ncbi:MFS transporter [Isoptericola sp. NPDC056618]|uniref:MFS transporter n=1 Tax=Isoptericola sp. NPDC056618 TaxID=3345878 RepID=UPI0036991AB2
MHHRDFRLLVAGQTTSQLGTQVAGVAVPLLAIDALGATAFEVGLLGAASTIAFLLVGLPAGAWLDRMRRRPVMIAADVVRAVALLSVPVAAWWGVLTMAQLLAVVLVVGFARVFFDVGYQAYVPALVSKDRVLAGNSVMELLRSGGQVAGPGLGGVLVSVLGARERRARAVTHVRGVRRLVARDPRAGAIAAADGTGQHPARRDR